MLVLLVEILMKMNSVMTGLLVLVVVMLLLKIVKVSGVMAMVVVVVLMILLIVVGEGGENDGWYVVLTIGLMLVGRMTVMWF